MPGMIVLESQLFQGPPDKGGAETDAPAPETGDDLAGGKIFADLHALRFPVISEDQFPGQVGRLEAPVALIEGIDLPIPVPIAKAAIEQSLGLRVNGVVVDRTRPGAFDARHLKDQPAAIAGVVGEEERVVARGAERGHVRQVDLVPAVSGSLVDEEGGGHGLDLVQFGGPHGVDLLKVDQQLFRNGQEVVLGEPLAVGLRGVITAEAGRQQVLHERGLVATLWPDQDKDQLVDDALVEGAGQEANEPTTKALSKLGLLPMGDMHPAGELPDGVADAIPSG